MKGICECDSLGFNLVYCKWPEGKSLTVGKAVKLVKMYPLLHIFQSNPELLCLTPLLLGL